MRNNDHIISKRRWLKMNFWGSVLAFLTLAILVLLSMLGNKNQELKEEKNENWDLIEENNELKNKISELKENFNNLIEEMKDENKFLKDTMIYFKNGKMDLEDDPIEEVVDIVKSYNKTLKYYKDYIGKLKII